MTSAARFKILYNYITVCNYIFLVEIITNSVSKKKTTLIAPVSSHVLVRSLNNPKLKKALNAFTYLVPDSQWIKRSIYFLYGRKTKDRIYGPDLMLKVCKLAENKNYGVFLYGSTQKTLSKLQKRLKFLFPKLIISDSLSSKFAPLTAEEKTNLINRIKRSKTKIIFIALGEPLQEIFTHDLIYKKPTLNIPITIITVGAAFDFISGVKHQSPIWIQNLGFEWLFRLLTEPKRLWKRYLIYGPLFIILILKQKAEILLNITHNIVIKNKIRSRNA